MGHAESKIKPIDFSGLEGPTGTSAHDRILATACHMFYRHGINAVGIDRIIAESGVAKMSLYRNFGSKQALVEAYLKHRDACWQDVFRDHILALDLPAVDKILAYFDLMHAWLCRPEFSGCAYINATAECTGANAVTEIIQHHKERNLDLLTTQAAQAGFDHATELAEQLFLLTEGAIVTASISGSPEPMRTAKTAARQLLSTAGA